MKVGKDRKSSVLPADETSMFCTQIALVLKSGISLADGTEAIYSSCENGPGKKYFEEISTAVTQTGSLYEAVKQVGIFPSYMVEMTGIGERAGKLDDVMEALGLCSEREHNIKKSIKNAVLYPSVLFNDAGNCNCCPCQSGCFPCLLPTFLNHWVFSRTAAPVS